MLQGRALAVLRDFLPAQSAKDCAIMVCMQRVSGAPAATDSSGVESVARDDATGVSVRYRVAFVDMDLKHVHRMPEYWALDQAVQAVAADDLRLFAL
jgi:hypothetical protein